MRHLPVASGGNTAIGRGGARTAAGFSTGEPLIHVDTTDRDARRRPRTRTERVGTALPSTGKFTANAAAEVHKPSRFHPAVPRMTVRRQSHQTAANTGDEMTNLRSNAHIGTTWEALRRSHWSAMGLTPEDQAKPKIAVVNSSSELAICYRHLDGVADVLLP